MTPFEQIALGFYVTVGVLIACMVVAVGFGIGLWLSQLG